MLTRSPRDGSRSGRPKTQWKKEFHHSNYCVPRRSRNELEHGRRSSGLGELLAVVIQGVDALPEVVHHIAEVVVLMDVVVPYLRQIPAYLDTIQRGGAALVDLSDVDGRDVRELNTKRPLHKPDCGARGVPELPPELEGQRPEREVLHVVGELLIHLIKVWVVVELLVIYARELPSVLHSEVLLGIAVDGEVVRDNRRHVVVLDAQRSPLGIHGTYCTSVFEVQPQAVGLRRLRLRLRHGLGRRLHGHGLVHRLWLGHDLEEAAEAAAEHHECTKQHEPPRHAQIDLCDAGANGLVADALARSEVCSIADPASSR
mmetsp:Transcript_98358/g.286856  ORF Transcript_98358/g.286856 Transcript_98358/m.286856 type:complete len:315 (+) Transcript_98358:32-976(+)